MGVVYPKIGVTSKFRTQPNKSPPSRYSESAPDTETASHMNGSATCTQKQCQWVIQKNIPYAPLDFSSAKSKKRKIDSAIASTSKSSTTPVKRVALVERDSPDHDIKSLYPAILSLVPPHAQDYAPKSTLPNFPKPLPSLYLSSFHQLNYAELLSASVEAHDQLVLTTEMVEAVEKETRDQSRSKLWYRYRAGRVTASKVKAVCRTDSDQPSQSLIKSICYPEAFLAIWSIVGQSSPILVVTYRIFSLLGAYRL
jgi:hypothetical protein